MTSNARLACAAPVVTDWRVRLPVAPVTSAASVPGFWPVQLTAWSALLVVGAAYYHQAFHTTWAAFASSTLCVALGVGISTGLRALYRRVLARHWRMIPATVLTLATCYAAAWLWIIAIHYLMVATGLARWHKALPPLNWHSCVVFTVPLLGWSACYFALRHWRERNLARRRAEEADQLARAAQLDLLRYQLNPHFVLNALNSIRSELPLELNTPREMITHLASYLRHALAPSQPDFIPLSEEIASLEHYLAIERARFGDRLKTELAVEPSAASVRIPVFVLQPLVENAIKHGRRGQTQLTIRITASVENGVATVCVANTGQWLPTRNGDNSTGVGLKNARSRLELAWPGRARLETSEIDGWMNVRLCFPRR